MSIAVEPEATRLSVAVGGREITFETGVVAKQAHGAVLVQPEGTVVLATAVGRTEGREGADFFPLTVDIEEKMYAAGKIPGGFFKREGRAGEKAILTARMVDRPIRPLWPKGFKNEVQVIVTMLSADQVARPRHPGHQRRLGGADAVAAALHGPGRRRARRPDRGRAGAQPDAARDGGLDARPDRLRHPRRDHDGRGRRRAGRRGRPARRAGAGPRGDQAALRRRRSSCRPRPASRSGTTRASAEQLALRATARRFDARPSPSTAWPASAPGRRAIFRASCPTSPPTPARTTWCAACRCSRGHRRSRASPRRGGQARGRRAVRRPDPRAVRRRAGLQGAQVGQAPGAGRADRRRDRAAFPGRGEPTSTARDLDAPATAARGRAAAD